MDPKDSRTFSSKILLFGEYLVLLGGQSLSFPYSAFTLKRSRECSPKNRYFFQKFLAYIQQSALLHSKLNAEFKTQIEKGLHYESSIPVGYGLGSSGALVAAIYHDFFHPKETDFSALKKDLAELESFFHEKSSGIDPLTSYLDKPVLSTQKGIEIAPYAGLGAFQLYDSGQKRSAREAIQHFNKLYLYTSFKKGLSELTELSNIMLHKYRHNENIQHEMKAYAQRQILFFKDFIPENVRIEWKKGLETDEFYMKLCGAGMGGMYLKYKTEST